MQVNKQLADFGISGGMAHPANAAFSGTAMPMRVTQPRIQKHENLEPANVNLAVGPSGLANNVDNINPMVMGENTYNYGPQNVCAQSMNSDVFSQFSMPSNNLMVNNFVANNGNIDASKGGFSQINMTQTGPRIRSNIDGDELPAPTEIYSRVGAPPANAAFARSGISESQSEFNSGIQSLNNRAANAGDAARTLTSGVGVPLQMCQSNYDGMNA